jgi:hypothetical protein
VEIFQIKKITVEKLRFVIPIRDRALSGKDRRLLELSGPDGSIWPGVGMLLQIDGFKRQARYAVGIVEASHCVWMSVPARIHVPMGSSIAVGMVAKHITSVVQNDVENDIDVGSMGRFHQLHQISPRAEMRVNLEEIVNPVAMVGIVKGNLLEDGTDPYGGHPETLKIADFAG